MRLEACKLLHDIKQAANLLEEFTTEKSMSCRHTIDALHFLATTLWTDSRL